jgi:hypothetical protein
MNQRFAVLQELGEQFERAVADADAAGSCSSAAAAAAAGWSRFRFGLLTRRLWPLAGAACAALVAGIVAAVVLLSAGTPTAYAGWAAVPTTPTASALETAVHKCYQVGARDGQLGLLAPGGTAQPVLAEARGRSAAAVYAIDGQVYMCLYENGSTYRTVASASMGPLRVTPAPDHLSIPYGVYGGSESGTRTHPLTPAQRQKLKSEAPTAIRQLARNSLIDGGGYFALGQAGSDVSAVKFSFANGKTVTASVQNGWYFAWWPWTSDPTSVTVTTSTGAITSPMKDTWPGGLGSRPYPACQPGSSGCVFDTKQPAAPATNTTSARTTTAPTTSTPAATQVATATQECDALTLTYQVMPADAFSGHVLLTAVHGISTALLNVADGTVDVCVIGGVQKDVHKFFAFHIETDGQVRLAPGPDQISVPYAGHNGVGGGRPFGRRPGKNATPAQRHAEERVQLERIQGGGYGPYTFGQAGRDVSAVTITFANGKKLAAKVENGWYFAWWPLTNASAPTTVTVTTSSGTTTSPINSSNGVNVAAGCQPGTSGCVFVKTPHAPTATTSPTTQATTGTTNTTPTTTTSS